MTDRTALPEPGNSPENEAGEGVHDPRQAIFANRFAKLTDGFGQACEQEGVETAIAIAIHPGEKHPIVFIKGHQYDVGVLTARVLKIITRALMDPLMGEDDPSED